MQMLKPPQVNISFENNRRIYSGGAELNPTFSNGGPVPTSVFVHNNLMRGGV